MPEYRAFAETSLEHLRLALSVGQVGVWELDIATGKAWRNERHDAIFGHDDMLPEWSYDIFLDYVVPEDRGRVDQLQSDAIERRQPWVFECRIARADGAIRWISAAGRPLLDNEGNPTTLIGHVVDITPTKENEDRLELLTGELDHRVRNLLATIRAILRMSAAKASDVATFARSLDGRVGALTRSHELLVRGGSHEANIRFIVEQELAAFDELRQRVSINGDTGTALPGKSVQIIALALHELCTNAIKYGALSNETGTVAIEITEIEGFGLRIHWQESGGPEVEAPARKGFGTTMIDRLLSLYGQAEFEFHPSGLRCQLDIKTL